MKKIPRISSALKSLDLKQTPPPLIIGERVNTQGSRKAKKMVLNDDFDGLIDLARTQVEEGAHCLDVCVATTERSDELDFMKKLVKRLSLEVEAPLVIDSTDPIVIKSAIGQIPGKPIINSINLEGDGSRFHSLAPLMKKYGIPAIAMCIGPKGMAKTPSEKLKIAKKMLDVGKQYNLQPWQFIFDVLTFTLATGQDEFLNSAKYTLEGIKLVKKNLPNCFTTLGLSNVSFGLPSNARKIVNSVFLYHSIQNGLDSVIINPKDIIPYNQLDKTEKLLAENLIFNKNNNALSELITHFEKADSNVLNSKNIKSNRTEIDPAWIPTKKCYYRITNRLIDGIEKDIVDAIKFNVDIIRKRKNNKNISNQNGIVETSDKQVYHDAAVKTLNETLLPAMKEVGDKFGAGEIILPFVLKSAECMKAAVSELEKYLIKKEDTSKGKIVLCTVYGDVHDIGKNLVKTILVNNGYTVFDLGKQVPIQTIVNKIREVDADVVGLSALLVSTSKQMQIFVEYIKEHKINIPVLCGGAAINSDFINRIASNNSIYNPGVFYCKTAFDGLNVVNNLKSENKDKFLSNWKIQLLKSKEDHDRRNNTQIFNKIIADLSSYSSNIKPVIHPPKPPHINKQVRLDYRNINLNEVWKFINKKSLFVLSWSFRGRASNNLSKESEDLYLKWKNKVINENLFSPSVVYGYFVCHNRNNKLVVDSRDGEEIIFEFPRSTQQKHLCLTDYFGKNDIIAFQAVTVGKKVSEIIDKWNNENRYTDAYYLHGLAVETAEALAEWTNNLIKSELKLTDKNGLRYSWGYPSCPDISQHKLVWKLLDPDKSGMNLSESGQIIPDQSTAAMIVHHPQAEYFVL
ncbi:MAG: dihydropteroate synthase [Nitrososphaeraceae archaeon]